jgi:DhnA family fructose-bisphosphate aldolase class Ia
MNEGKTRRLKKIFQKDNRTVIVPMDHGVTVGPIQGITNMQEITNQLVKGKADASSSIKASPNASTPTAQA